MTHAVILRRKAEDDIRKVLRWYESQDPSLGEQFLIELRRTLEQIGQFPESSPALHKSVRRPSSGDFRIWFSTSPTPPGLSFSQSCTLHAIRLSGPRDSPRGLTLRSTGRAGTCLQLGDRLVGAPVTSNVRPHLCASAASPATTRSIHSSISVSTALILAMRLRLLGAFAPRLTLNDFIPCES